MNTWHVHAFALEAMSADFPYARSLIVVRSERTIKKTGMGSVESRYYPSAPPISVQVPDMETGLEDVADREPQLVESSTLCT